MSGGFTYRGLTWRDWFKPSSWVRLRVFIPIIPSGLEKWDDAKTKSLSGSLTRGAIIKGD